MDLNTPNLLSDVNDQPVIFLDAGRYAQMAESNQVVYLRELRGVLEGLGVEDANLDEGMASIVEQFIGDDGAPSQVMEKSGGGLAGQFTDGELDGIKLVVVDGRVSSLGQVAKLSLEGTMDGGISSQFKDSIKFDFLSEQNQEHYDIFVREHELAHALKRMNGEAGADYIATAEMLKEYPESRATLTFVADMRLARSLIPDSLESNEVLERYGYENHKAMKTLLDMKPEALSELSSQQLRSNAQDFDTLSLQNQQASLSPGAVAFDILRGGGADPVSEGKMNSRDSTIISKHAFNIQQEYRATAQQISEMPSDGDVTSDHEEAVWKEGEKILDDFVDVMERVSTVGYGQELKQQAAPQLSSAPASVAPALGQ